MKDNMQWVWNNKFVRILIAKCIPHSIIERDVLKIWSNIEWFKYELKNKEKKNDLHFV